MAYPVVEEVLTQAFPGDISDPLPVDMPTTVNNGELLIIAVGLGESRGRGAPSGWTNLVIEVHTEIYYKFADGTEGGTTVNVDLTSPSRAGVIVKRISGAVGGVEAVYFASVSDSNTPDPPSITASFGQADNLFIAGFSDSASTGFISPVTGPTGYSNSTFIGSGDNTSQDGNIAIATLQKDSATEDPPAFTTDGSLSWESFTIVVQGSTVKIPSVTFKDAQGNPIEGGSVFWTAETAFAATSPAWNNLQIVGIVQSTDVNGVVTFSGTVDAAKVYTAHLRDYVYNATSGAWEKAQGADTGKQNVDLTAPA